MLGPHGQGFVDQKQVRWLESWIRLSCWAELFLLGCVALSAVVLAERAICPSPPALSENATEISCRTRLPWNTSRHYFHFPPVLSFWFGVMPISTQGPYGVSSCNPGQHFANKNLHAVVWLWPQSWSFQIVFKDWQFLFWFRLSMTSKCSYISFESFFCLLAFLLGFTPCVAQELVQVLWSGITPLSQETILSVEGSNVV